jgi:hypothetical protein
VAFEQQALPIITPSKRDKFEFSAIIGVATGIAGFFKGTWPDELGESMIERIL